MKGIYIMGQTPRTGTNFLFKLLLKHESIIRSEHPGEDKLLIEIHKLNDYIHLTSNQWSEEWKGMNKAKFSTRLLGAFQSSFISYLTPSTANGKYILTKSPSTVGIESFFKFFPDVKPIILIRDGRNVVESLVQSFNMPYLKAMKKWSESGQRISKELTKYPNQYLVVKYEDLFLNTENEIKRILLFLELEEAGFNFKEIKEIPIIGSSQSAKRKGNVDWAVNLNKKNFNPNERFSQWNFFKRLMYNNICGKVAQKLGYSKA